MGSPQIQESILDRASPQQRQSMPSQPINNGSPALSQPSPDIPKWMEESTALYNMNQGLAVSSFVCVYTYLKLNCFITCSL